MIMVSKQGKESWEVRSWDGDRVSLGGALLNRHLPSDTAGEEPQERWMLHTSSYALCGESVHFLHY